MRGLLAALWLSTVATSVLAQSAAREPASVKPGGLAEALRELSVRTRTGILFSPDGLAEIGARDVPANAGLKEALGILLADTGLTYLRTGSGTVVIVRAAGATPAPPAIPEILVVGARFQNEDIRRSENDIQPYRVLGSRELSLPGDRNLGDVLRTQLTNVTPGLAPWQDPVAGRGTNRSEVNLQGLGANQTLVLVDGSRMPPVPSSDYELNLYQPDLNGLPVFAIDRVETLTATSGGIYGPSAVGGMVNVVLKRDYRGADFGLSYGLTQRGDAPYRRLDGRIGFSPDGGRTDVMMAFSLSDVGRLEAGSRSFALQSLRLNAQADPRYLVNAFPHVDGLVVEAPYGFLAFSGPLGGAQLGADYTYLPLDYPGLNADGGAALIKNAGTFPLALARDANGIHRSLTNGARTSSVIASLRQRSIAGVEFFLDLLAYRDMGSAQSGGDAFAFIGQGAANNPFDEIVTVRFPEPDLKTNVRSTLTTVRGSGGLLARLPHAWSAEARLAYGLAESRFRTTSTVFDGEFGDAIQDGLPSPSGRPALNPFGDAVAFQNALRSYVVSVQGQDVRRTEMTDANVRLAGPVLTTSAGSYSLSLLAERRRERVPDEITPNPLNPYSATQYPRFSQTVSSLYGELRAPLVARENAKSPLRGLELQLALRYDATRSSVPVIDNTHTIDQSEYQTSKRAVVYTTGLRAFPVSDLMVRASMASGFQPPTPSQLFEQFSAVGSSQPDPRRGNTGVGFMTVLSRGSPKLRPERARSISAGLVWNPEAGRRPRISLDYTRIEKRNEISDVHLYDFAYFLANESLFPDRVVRAPLTQADRDAGYEAGKVTLIDTSAMNIGRATLQTVDLRADWTVDPDPNEQIQLSGAVTWAPNFTRRLAPEQPLIHYVGYADGPLRWRANGLVAWTRQRLTLRLDGQFYDTYRSTDADAHVGLYRPATDLRVPRQIYVNVAASYRLGIGGFGARPGSLEFAFGIEDLFDRLPPAVINTGAGYSPFGDVRGRRFTSSLMARF